MRLFFLTLVTDRVFSLPEGVRVTLSPEDRTLSVPESTPSPGTDRNTPHTPQRYEELCLLVTHVCISQASVRSVGPERELDLRKNNKTLFYEM